MLPKAIMFHRKNEGLVYGTKEGILLFGYCLQVTVVLIEQWWKLQGKDSDGGSNQGKEREL